MIKMQNDLYMVIEHYYGKFDDKRIIAYTPTIQDAKIIVERMEKAMEDRPFSFTYKRTYSFEDVPFSEITDTMPLSLFDLI